MILLFLFNVASHYLVALVDYTNKHYILFTSKEHKYIVMKHPPKKAPNLIIKFGAN